MHIFRIGFLSLALAGVIAGASAELKAKQSANSGGDPIPVCPFRHCPATSTGK